MTVHQFIRSRHDQWQQLERFLEQARRSSLARVSLDEFRHGSRLYREAISDLAYARMRFQGHSVIGELERLAALGHSLLYQAGRSRSRRRPRWGAIWAARVRQAALLILMATGIFWISAAVGFLLTAQNPALERFFVTREMREAIASGKLWTESVTRVAPHASSRIAINNINVSLLTWGLGLTFGIGTVWLLVLNGIMLGAVAAACLRADLLGPLLQFVIGHGSLELPAIWISGGAGLILARALVFPGRYSRSIELRQGAQRSVQIMMGVIPLLLIAAAVEGFVSPSELPGWIKAALGLSLFLALVAYVVSVRTPASEEGESTHP
jgi:uncharacterized membrane protein SpoIIM required for sporulation